MTLNVRVLSIELAEKAKNELNEDPSRIPADFQAIREWLKKQPHLNARTDDQFLLAFLRGCKFSLQRAKEKIDMYYTMRTAVPEFFSKRDPLNAKLQVVIDHGISLPLPIATNSADPRIFLIRQGAYDANKIHILDVVKVSYMITDLLLLEDDNTEVAGQIIIVDLKGLTFGHLGQFNPTLIKKMATVVQESFPIRQRGIHFVHPLPGFYSLFNIFKSIMNDKIKERLHVHDNMKSLQEHIPKSLLPAEYGGDAGPIQNIIDHWKQHLESKRDWFLEDERFRSDESRRPGKPKTAETLFGIEGSFRKLEVD